MWIESGAPYAGSYAALRNAQQQTVENNAAWRVFGEHPQVLQRRCGSCHAVGDLKNETGRALPFSPITANNRRGVQRATGVYERVVLDEDPLTKFSCDILVNMTRPELSPLLLGPLAKEAGGWGSCGQVFTTQDDPDYQLLLDSLQKGKQTADQQPRYSTPGFQPNRQYIRELKRYGVLPEHFDPATTPLDYFAADQDYWRTYWLGTSK